MKCLKIFVISFAIVAYCFNRIYAAKIEETAKFELVDNFRTPKNIMFSCMYGGSSHVLWVLTILEELTKRGHSTFYQTRDNQVKFSKDFPSIRTSSIGPEYDREGKEELVKKLRSNHVESLKQVLMGPTLVFKEEYTTIKDFIKSNNIDIAICDTLNSACMEASISSKIPFILTGTSLFGSDSSAPYINNIFFHVGSATTEHMTLKERLRSTIVTPIQFLLSIRDVTRMRSQAYMALGLTPSRYPDQKWKNSIKMINSAFGFEPARPLGSLTEMVGPIMPRSYSALNSQISFFLEGRSKVAYAAFGQHAVATESDGRLIITALLESLEAKHIDGIIWATRDVSNMFPRYVTTSSNTTYDVHSFRDIEEGVKSNIIFLNWAPQMAILQHPSTSFFITHCGAGSLYEAMYAGKRVIAYPFFLDQHPAAHNVESNEIGLRLDRKSTQEDANKIIQKVAIDENEVIQSNANRLKALVQIKSKYGTIRGADIVEEVSFTHKEDGKIPHRYPPSRNMSFMKANNYDVYLFLLVSAICFGYGLLTIFSYFTTSVPIPKSKTI